MPYLLELAKTSPIYPQALADRPELDERLDLLYGVFKEISRGRKYDMGHPLPLSYSDVFRYCEFNDIFDIYTKELYYEFCLMVDDIWLNLKNKKLEADKAGQQSAKSGSKKGRK